MRPGNDFSPSHRLSMTLDNGQGPSRISSRLDDGMPTDKHSFPNLKERSEIQKERDLNVDTDNPQFINFLKYGIRKDQNEWSPPRSLGDIKIFNKKLNCSLRIPANLSSNLVVNLPKDLNQWRLKDPLPDERKYVIYNHNLNALIKAPFGGLTTFPNDPNPLFSSYNKSQESIAFSCNTSSSETKIEILYKQHCIICNTNTPRTLRLPTRLSIDCITLGNRICYC